MDHKYIIIGLLVIIVVLICGVAYIVMSPQTEYTTVHIVENGTTMEIPKDMNIKSENNQSDIVVLENDNTIIILFNTQNKDLVQISNFAYIKNPIFGSEFSGNVTLKDPTVAGCSLKGECNGVFIGNDETHDNIIIISEDENIVNHIVNSIKWKVPSVTEKTSEDTNASETTSSSQPHYDAYCKFCGKGIIWPEEGEKWYVCDECMKTHEKEINDELEKEYEENVEEYEEEYE